MLLFFRILLLVQFLVVVTHDMLDIPGWTAGSQVRTTLGNAKFWAATGINAIFPLTAVIVVLFT